MNEKDHWLHHRFLSAGDISQLRRSAPCGNLAGAGSRLKHYFSFLYRHDTHQAPSRLEVI